ncbi:MAG: quinol:cytochrome C oxidoreductase [Flavisolibacter sp.]
MAIKEQFAIPKKYNNFSYALMAIGILSIIILYISSGSKTDPYEQARFWASLLQNSVYFLLVVNAAMFFICATSLAWGGWQISFRRVTEAISVCVPVIGIITFIILMAVVFGGNHALYHWADPNMVKTDNALQHKSGFLNKGFFTTVTIITILGWSWLGYKIRQLSRSTDRQRMDLEEAKKYNWNITIWSAIYIVLFSLTVMSSLPWLWLMSIDAHWYSTMYSWYTFASTFVAGVALITLFVVFLKNNGYLEYTNKEHLHDLGKFIFAFSIFWTYLWFDQFMLIWYANLPEETIYFNVRMQGPYRGLFFLNLIINFVAPFLILMTRGSKRNYGTITMIAVLILLGHWLDFYQMVMPAISPKHVPFMLVDMGIGVGFIGLIMFVTARALTKAPMIAKNNPFIKESIIHHT